MTTIRYVANTAGVSIATVSHLVYNARRVSPDTRRRVERAIVELRFRPDEAGRRLARRRYDSVEGLTESPDGSGTTLISSQATRSVSPFKTAAEIPTRNNPSTVVCRPKRAECLRSGR